MNSEVARRRSASPHASMFLRMLVRAAVLRRGRAASALLAMAVAAAAATAMLNLYVDVQAKLRREFRKYGANVVVVAKEGEDLPKDGLSTVRSILANAGIAVPFAYAVARTSDGHSVVVAGTDLDQVQKLDSWWSVTGWPKAQRDALIGRRAAGVLNSSGKPFDLSFQGRTVQLNPAGTLQTGADEDSRVYISLADFTEWTHVPYSTIEISALSSSQEGSSQEIEATMRRLAQALPGADVRPVRQVMEGEARVLGKMRSTLLVASARRVRQIDPGILRRRGCRYRRGWINTRLCHRSRGGHLDRADEFSLPGDAAFRRFPGRFGGRNNDRAARGNSADISAPASPTC